LGDEGQTLSWKGWELSILFAELLAGAVAVAACIPGRLARLRGVGVSR
jgi:hypothetical protein